MSLTKTHRLVAAALVVLVGTVCSIAYAQTCNNVSNAVCTPGSGTPPYVPGFNCYWNMMEMDCVELAEGYCPNDVFLYDTWNPAFCTGPISGNQCNRSLQTVQLSEFWVQCLPPIYAPDCWCETYYVGEVESPNKCQCVF